MRRVMRAGSGFGVVLNGEYGKLFMLHALAGAVIQIHMRHHDVFVGNRVHVHGKTMILGRYVHGFGMQVYHRLVAAVMPEFQFERLPAESLAQDLMAQADPEYRHFIQKGFHRVHYIRKRFGVARPV